MIRRHDLRNALLCAAAVAAAFFVVNPFVNMPFDDDWCYSFTVHQFLATGRITYSGWSAPLIITHAWWGALFCKIFGYSFITLRLSTFPLAIGCAIFAYLLARAGNLRPAACVLLTLTLCLSPLFLPLALSFMTDVPSVCYILISLYCLLRAGQAAANRRAIAWLALGALIGIFGGMGRQTVWFAPLCVIPYLAILRRHDRSFFIAAILAWVLVAIDMFACLRWFSRQPDIYIDPPLSQCIRMAFAKPGIWITNIIMVVFTTVLFTLPAALPFTIDFLASLWRQRKSANSAIAGVVIFALAAGISFHPAFGMAPWLYNTVTTRGVVGALELSGNRPTVLSLWALGIVSALVLITTYLLVAKTALYLVRWRSSFSRLRQFLSVPSSQSVLTVFAAFYFASMVIRAGQDLVFDRYCLPLIPFLAILLLRNRSLKFAWPLLIIFACYAVASTQDNLALAAARRAAINRLESHGVPPTQIEAGFEHDFYTQLETSGRINRYGISNPIQPFDPFKGYTPAMKCRYRLEYPRLTGTKPSPFGVVDYTSWLPPFHRRIYIDEFKNPWWLDPHLPKDKIVPMNFEFDFGD